MENDGMIGRYHLGYLPVTTPAFYHLEVVESCLGNIIGQIPPSPLPLGYHRFFACGRKVVTSIFSILSPPLSTSFFSLKKKRRNKPPEKERVRAQGGGATRFVLPERLGT